MGQGTRKSELRQRRHRREKARKLKEREKLANKGAEIKK